MKQDVKSVKVFFKSRCTLDTKKAIFFVDRRGKNLPIIRNKDKDVAFVKDHIVGTKLKDVIVIYTQSVAVRIN